MELREGTPSTSELAGPYKGQYSKDEFIQSSHRSPRSLLRGLGNLGHQAEALDLDLSLSLSLEEVGVEF